LRHPRSGGAFLPVGEPQHAVESHLGVGFLRGDGGQIPDLALQLNGAQSTHPAMVEGEIRECAIATLLPLGIQAGHQHRARFQRQGRGARGHGEGHRHPIRRAGARREAKPLLVVVVEFAGRQGVEQLALMPQQANEHEQQHKMGPAKPGQLGRAPLPPVTRLRPVAGDGLSRELPMATEGLPRERR